MYYVKMCFTFYSPELPIFEFEISALIEKLEDKKA